MMIDKNHDLFDFFKNANDNIEKEYKRICKTEKEDPGTAGDQGEENWKELLEQWLPPYFHIESKGRILFENGKTSPQIDIIVLSPEYPKQLWGCKKYLSSGVVAAFECKTTLRSKCINDFIEHSIQIRDLTRKETGTPRRDLHSSIYYGLLAHSHCWNKNESNPINNVSRALSRNINEKISHPIQLPNVICVADLAVWSSVKIIVPAQPNSTDSRFSQNTVRAGYLNVSEDYHNDGLYTPVGGMIFSVLSFLSWKYPGLRDFVSYMNSLNVAGCGVGDARDWGFDVFSSQTQNNMNKCGLRNMACYDEWCMLIE